MNAIVQQDTAGFKKRDKVYLLLYRGEGAYDIWYKGKISNSDESNVLIKIIQASKMTWWVKVKLNNGKQGWLKLKNVAKEGGFRIKENIDGMDKFS